MIRLLLGLPEMPFRGDRLAYHTRITLRWFRSHRGWIIDSLIRDQLFHIHCLRCLA